MMIGFAIIALPFAGADGQGLGGSLNRLPDLILVEIATACGQGLGGSLHRLPDLILVTTRVVHCCLILEYTSEIATACATIGIESCITNH